MNAVQVLNMFAMMTSFSMPEVIDDGLVYFPSETKAVTAAANLYNPRSIQEDREYMGAIYETEQGFRFTVTIGEKRTDKIQISLPSEDFDKVVAFWHTHGNADPWHRYFSDVDTETANKYARPLYLADYTGYLKVFEPGDSVISLYAAQRLGLPASRGYATGELVKDEWRRSVRVDTKSNSRYC